MMKKDGGLWYHCEFRKLNEVTCKDVYPLPCVEESLDALGNARVFSNLALTSGYFQVAVEEQDREKTTMTTLFGLLEWTHMPFDLSNTFTMFQKLMEGALEDDILGTLLTYLDITVFSRYFKSHMEKLDCLHTFEGSWLETET
ncbi:unnamed protein product [Caretta caretta]